MDEVLARERTRDWVPDVESLIASGGAFVAVGCLHLTGPDGLVELLRARGHAVGRVPATRR